MIKAKEFILNGPTAFDSSSNFSGSLPEDCWYVAYTRARDSDTLIRSNWKAFEKLLEEFEEDVQIDRYGHWAVGWYEVLSVREDTEAYRLAQEIVEGLEEYPVIDESLLSEMEFDEAQEVWSSCYNDSERINYIREYRDQFDFDSLYDMFCCAKGMFFCGYCCDLIQR